MYGKANVTEQDVIYRISRIILQLEDTKEQAKGIGKDHIVDYVNKAIETLKDMEEK